LISLFLILIDLLLSLLMLSPLPLGLGFVDEPTDIPDDPITE
jgi:hypothetical protein